MPVQLSDATIQKLTHESSEIRMRTLDQIDAKLLRALAHDEEIEFRPGELFKQLIRWFGQQPLKSKIKVLQLMLALLRSKYVDSVMEHLGVKRCERELNKVKQILMGAGGESSVRELELVEKLIQHCREIKQKIDQPSMEEVIDLTDALTISEREASAPAANSKQRVLNEFPEEDYELPWSNPPIADYNSMKHVAELLVNPQATADELQNALQHLQLTMIDYPAEYFLQAPYIFLSILKLHERHEEINCSPEEILNTLVDYTLLLKERLHMRRKALTYEPPLRGGQTVAVPHMTQLRLSKVLQLLFELTLKYFETSYDVLSNEVHRIKIIFHLCLEICIFQNITVDKRVINRLNKACAAAKERYLESEHFTLQRIHHLETLFLLQRVYEINTHLDSTTDLTYLSCILHDYALKVCFADRYESAKQSLLAQESVDLKIKLQYLESYERQICLIVSLLKTPKNFNAHEIIECSSDLLPRALQTFASSQLLAIMFDAIVSCLPQYMTNTTFRERANHLLLKLLSLADEKLAVRVFKCLANTFKQHLSALMGGIVFSAAQGCCQHKLLACQIIGVPLSTSLLLKLTYSNFECEDLQIKQSCEDILSMLLRSQHLLGANWCRLLELVLPIMPLLQCCTQAPKITDAILKLLDPDVRQLPFLEMLKCNIRWLFHPEVAIRRECINRLIYMLQSLEKSTQYMPNLLEISDLLNQDICLFGAHRSFSSIFAAEDATEQSEYLTTLYNLLAMLDSTDIEPMIRKTTLMQLNILCQKWPISVEICRESAYYFALQTLENALRKTSYADYLDTAIPATGILAKLLCCDPEFREELARAENVYVLLLRVLFLYWNDLQARQDAVLCLFLLLFSTYILIAPPGRSMNGVEVPALMANLQLPVKVRLQPSQRVEEPINDGFPYASFNSALEETLFLRQLIASTFCDGFSKVSGTWLETQKQYDFNVHLQLTPREWRLMKATQPLKNLRRFLKAAENATNHTALINAVRSLKLQLSLNCFTAGAHCLPSDIALDLVKLLNKYLQMPPGNQMDFLLFEQLLELCDLCIRLKYTEIIEGLFKVLQDDFQHSFLILLQSPETELPLYRKITKTMTLLLPAINSISSGDTHSASHTHSITDSTAVFYTSLFELLFTVAKLFFDQRDLLRVRCLLSLLQLLSTTPLEMSDNQLHQYCKRFLNLSIALKSFTQTGSQWQRDCLQLVCHLSAQMTEAQKVFKLSESFVKYLSGLCGHNDCHVRSLAWCVLTAVAGFDDGTGETGATQLKNELSYLPGGFMACCLSTLLDYAEVGLVRHLAGNLFIELLPKCMDYAEVCKLLERHAFYRSFHEALGLCECDAILPVDFKERVDANLNCCEVISCLCRICIAVLHMEPSHITDLCGKSVMLKLYELFKVPRDESSCSQAYLVMCSDICQLYAMCYEENFSFLQRTLCRDQVWLRSFCLLLGRPFPDEEDQKHVLQLLSAVCRDQMGFRYVCENVAKRPEFIIKLFLEAFCVTTLNSSIQRCALDVLSFLLIRSQLDMEGDFITFADILEKPIELLDEDREEEQKEHELDDHHQKNRALNVKTLEAYHKSSAELLFIKLHRIFIHLYPLKACKFDTAPTLLKQQCCDTIGVLLKVSPLAQTAAGNLKFFDKLLQIFNTHLEEFNTSCATFIRRYGEAKKMAIINNFQLLLSIILSWYASGTATLSTETPVVGISKILLRIWPWLAYSPELKLLTLHLCATLSEHSLVVCKKFSSLISPHAHSILQLVLKIVIGETQKIKAASTEDFPVIKVGLLTAIHCCSCPEGRTTLLKARVFDLFDQMHPINPKAPKMKVDIIHSWLEFWEVFSRHADGAKVRNLNALCALIGKSTANSTSRLLALRILRNMCFANANRSALLNSMDFLCTLDEVISLRLDEDVLDADGTGTSFEEQLIVCLAICKLISGGIKYVAMFRGSKLGKKIKILFENVKGLKALDRHKFEEVPFAKDLYEVLEDIINVFNQ